MSLSLWQGTSYLQRQRLNTETSQLLLVFRSAQQFALASGRTTYICFADEHARCHSDSAIAKRWLVHQDNQSPRAPRASLIRLHIERNLQVDAKASWRLLAVGGNGLMKSWGNWQLCSGSFGRNITINRGLNLHPRDIDCSS